MENLDIKKTEEIIPSQTPNTDEKLGDTSLELVNLSEFIEPPEPPTMESFHHNGDDLAYDKERIKDLEGKIENRRYKRAQERLEKRGEGDSEDHLDKILAEEAAEEQLVSELFEEILADGIIEDRWINYSGKGKEMFNIRELASVNKADDYRNRIDVPFCFEFPETADKPAERLFIGFDATISVDGKVLYDKLTRSTNVSKEFKRDKNLPFGFSTMRYTYDPSNGMLLPADEAIRYTVCANKQLLNQMQKLHNDPRPLAEKFQTIGYQEVRFKVLSEIHEQNELFKAMNADNKKALEKISKIDTAIYRTIKNNIKHLLTFSSEKSPFLDLKPELNMLNDFSQQLSELPKGSEERKAIVAQRNELYDKLYKEISKRYSGANIGAKDISYGAMVRRTQELIDAALNTTALDKYKPMQPRNIPFDPNGNTIEMEEWYGKTDYK